MLPTPSETQLLPEGLQFTSEQFQVLITDQGYNTSSSDRPVLQGMGTIGRSGLDLLTPEEGIRLAAEMAEYLTWDIGRFSECPDLNGYNP